MFKLVVLSVLFAVAAARPGLYSSSPLVYSAPIVQEHSYAKVGAIVKSIPTAVSHQSSTVVHDQAHYVQPIVAPVVKTYAAPLVQTYHAAPVLKTYAAPAHYSYATAPLAYASAW
ncbi:uncharacterized protein LOC129912337 [Episyrphus balteatus]|uniref:uncharacterized protein LOC129912337 n=1 Tax=Episyrphus balteatus TaxID=286459 RepID=UPI002485D0D6|nr:uncharacterized protein LOC129912337 [Episyrphus balteatus]